MVSERREGIDTERRVKTPSRQEVSATADHRCSLQRRVERPATNRDAPPLWHFDSVTVIRFSQPQNCVVEPWTTAAQLDT